MQNANIREREDDANREKDRQGLGPAVSGLDQSQLDLAEILRRFRKALADTFQERDNLIGRCVGFLGLRLTTEHVTEAVVERG